MGLPLWRPGFKSQQGLGRGLMGVCLRALFKKKKEKKDQEKRNLVFHDSRNWMQTCVTCTVPKFETKAYRYDKLAKGKKINWMKAGIQECDLLLTDSPYYAEELRSVDECSYQLGAFIKSKQPAIKGIVNGVDVDKWSPFFYNIIFAKYDASTVNEAKPINMEAS